MAGKADTTPKTQRTKGYTKTPRISYERFYAIKYTITVEVLQREVKTPKQVYEFYGISDQTYGRIARADDYIAYKKLLRASTIKPGDETPPANILTLKQTTKARGKKAADGDDLDKAAHVLELAEGVLSQAYDIKRQAVAAANQTPAKRPGWFTRKA